MTEAELKKLDEGALVWVHNEYTSRPVRGVLFRQLGLFPQDACPLAVKCPLERDGELIWAPKTLSRFLETVYVTQEFEEGEYK